MHEDGYSPFVKKPTPPGYFFSKKFQREKLNITFFSLHDSKLIDAFHFTLKRFVLMLLGF
jgi:hypothetical protein